MIKRNNFSSSDKYFKHIVTYVPITNKFPSKLIESQKVSVALTFYRNWWIRIHRRSLVLSNYTLGLPFEDFLNLGDFRPRTNIQNRIFDFFYFHLRCTYIGVVLKIMFWKIKIRQKRIFLFTMLNIWRISLRNSCQKSCLGSRNLLLV